MAIGDSTARKYADKYREFLSSRKVEGERWEKFTPAAKVIIKRIFELSAAGKNRHEIKIQLKAEGYTQTIEQEENDVTDTVKRTAHRYIDTSPSLRPDATVSLTLSLEAQELISNKELIANEALKDCRRFRALLLLKMEQLEQVEKGRDEKVRQIEQEKEREIAYIKTRKDQEIEQLIEEKDRVAKKLEQQIVELEKKAKGELQRIQSEVLEWQTKKQKAQTKPKLKLEPA